MLYIYIRSVIKFFLNKYNIKFNIKYLLFFLYRKNNNISSGVYKKLYIFFKFIRNFFSIKLFEFTSLFILICRKNTGNKYNLLKNLSNYYNNIYVIRKINKFIKSTKLIDKLVERFNRYKRTTYAYIYRHKYKIRKIKFVHFYPVERMKLLYIVSFTRNFLSNVVNLGLYKYCNDDIYSNYSLSNVFYFFRKFGFNFEFIYYIFSKNNNNSLLFNSKFIKYKNWYYINNDYSCKIYKKKLDIISSTFLDRKLSYNNKQNQKKLIKLDNGKVSFIKDINISSVYFEKYKYIKNSVFLSLVKRLKILIIRYLKFLLSIFYKFFKKKYKFLKNLLVNKLNNRLLFLFKKKFDNKKILKYLINVYLSILLRGLLITKRIFFSKFIFYFESLFIFGKIKFKFYSKYFSKLLSYYLINNSNYTKKLFSLKKFFDIKYIYNLYKYKLLKFMVDKFVFKKYYLYENFLIQTKFKFLYNYLKYLFFNVDSNVLFMNKLLVIDNIFNEKYMYNNDNFNCLFLLKWMNFFNFSYIKLDEKINKNNLFFIKVFNKQNLLSTNNTISIYNNNSVFSKLIYTDFIYIYNKMSFFQLNYIYSINIMERCINNDLILKEELLKFDEEFMYFFINCKLLLYNVKRKFIFSNFYKINEDSASIFNKVINWNVFICRFDCLLAYPFNL